MLLPARKGGIACCHGWGCRLERSFRACLQSGGRTTALQGGSRRGRQGPANGQDVFITSLAIECGVIIITNERGEKYTLDLATRQVTRRK